MIKVDSFVKVALAVALLLVGVSVFYYLVVFLPHKEQAILDQQSESLADKEGLEQQQKEEAEVGLEECLSEVGYNDRWLESCRSLGLIPPSCFTETDPINFQDCICELPDDVVVRLDNFLAEEREKCFVLWPDADREAWEGWE